MQKDFTSSGFAVKSDIEIDEFDFSFTAMKKKEFFYVTEISSLSKDDILAYIDVVINDITVHNLKRTSISYSITSRNLSLFPYLL